MKEIEYKFLVNKELWEQVNKPTPYSIIQGYLSNNIDSTVRIRIKNDEAFLTVKGRTEGLSRTEFEYQIPKKDAQYMLNELVDKVLVKERYEIFHKGKRWEVDVFSGKLTGLILAELEVESVNEQFELPPWVTENVSLNPEYYNSNLIENC